ncbi:MAG TPA: ribonuclease H [Acidimicrobiales bacterium]|nr:ribonuclease H [Acidimicrobiales bacterium]
MHEPAGGEGRTRVVFTDGACQGNPGPGGWAWAENEHRFESGFDARTTNQRMELYAVLRALGANPGRLRIVSDSTYVVNCFRQAWWRGWRQKGWRNSRGEPVANQDLWRPIIEQVVDLRPGEVQLSWVKGHSGHPMNDLVDRLAVEAARSQAAVSSLD